MHEISVFHSSIKIVGNKTLYFDPYKIEADFHDADYIFITHEHYDHFSPEDITKVLKEGTVIVFPKSMEKDELKTQYTNTVFVDFNEKFNLGDDEVIEVCTLPAYNTNKKFHPKENEWVGYTIIFEGTSYYVAGDTDITEEAKSVKCDVAFLPCGGTYTMDVKEAAELANIIKPKVAIPTHYGSVVGSTEDGKNFVSLLNEGIEGKILIK